MKRNTAIITALLACLLLAGCATAKADQPTSTAFDEVSDKVDHELIVKHEAVKRERAMAAYADRVAAREAAEAVAREAEETLYEEPYYEPYAGDQSVGYMGNPDGLNNFDGTFEHEGREETFYSGDNAIYRDQLRVDDQGFYRTEEGYYAVAASDKEKGETFEGSQGTCYVIDGGNEPGCTDYAVSGWY